VATILARSVLTFGIGLVAPMGITPVLAQDDVIDATDIDGILEIARGYGNARKTTDSEGDPEITGKLGGISYSVYFYGCVDHEDCTSIQFYAGWDSTDVTVDDINAWNQENRFARAYIDSDNNPVVEMDVNLDYGVTTDNLDDSFDLWRILSDDFRENVIEKN
jgi:hypothetical protein